MKRYGSKKAARPYERIHRTKCRDGFSCGQCKSYESVPTKSGRAHENQFTAKHIALALSFDPCIVLGCTLEYGHTEPHEFV